MKEEYDKIFDYFYKNHGLILTESEIGDIFNVMRLDCDNEETENIIAKELCDMSDEQFNKTTKWFEIILERKK